MGSGDDAAALHHTSWHLLHTLAHSVSGKDGYRNFLALVRSLTHLYPCTECARRARDTFRDMERDRDWVVGDAAASYERAAVAWIIEFHNRINAHAHPGREVPAEYADPWSRRAFLAHTRQYDSGELACGGGGGGG